MSASQLTGWSRPGGQDSAEQEPESSSEPPPPPQRKWVALVSVPVLRGDVDDERGKGIVVVGGGGTDFLLDLNDPPLPSYLVMHPRAAVSPYYHPTPRNGNGDDDDEPPLSAYILAADRSASILLQVVDGNNRPSFFLCDTHTLRRTAIPPVPSYIQVSEGLDIRQNRSIALIADPNPTRRGEYLVDQLHPTTSSDRPDKLLCYSTDKARWFARHLTRRAQARMRNPFSENGVLAHDGRLWWLSLAYGVFFCNDPFASLLMQSHELRFLPLPDDCEMEDHVAAFDPLIKTLIDQRRCVRLSEGKLRFVEIRGLSYNVLVDDVAPVNPTVRMWTLGDPECEDPWTLDYEVPFAEIWDNETYADAELPLGEVPHVALVDPNDHYCCVASHHVRQGRIQ